MEITSKPTALDEINRSVLKLEMERLSLMNDTDRASRDRLNRLESELSLLKEKQAELTEQWEHEKSVMTRIQSIKEEVCDYLLLIIFKGPLSLIQLSKSEKNHMFYIEKKKKTSHEDSLSLCFHNVKQLL